jgi:hypothetical protein
MKEYPDQMNNMSNTTGIKCHAVNCLKVANIKKRQKIIFLVRVDIKTSLRRVHNFFQN